METVFATGDLQRRERKSQLLWTGGIIGFFAVQAVLWAVAITMTSSDPSHAIIPDYDQHALNWDAYQEELNASKRLGWVGAVSVRRDEKRAGKAIVQIDLRDASGQPVEDASVGVVMFHCGRAAEKTRLNLAGDGSGGYAGEFRLANSGHWQIEVTAIRGEDRFTSIQRHELGSELLGQSPRRYLDSRR